MSDPTPTPAPPAPAAPVDNPTPQGEPAGDEPLGEPGKAALVAEREARKAAEKTAGEYATRLKEIETASLSDLEKAQRTATEAQEAAAKASTEALRWRTAAKHGISDEDAETFLTGTDEATITRQAERLAALSAAPTTPPGPRPDLTQGGTGGASGSGGPAADFGKFLTNQLG